MENTNVKVSVIVLTYNHEKYIRQALDSILMQKVDFRYEILVGDDASTDQTAGILKAYQRQYPDVIKLQLREKNLGATANAYELFYMADGEYISSCEGDDYWVDSNKLQKQVDFLDANPQYIGCAHKCEIVDENGVSATKQVLPWVTKKRNYTLRDFRGLILPGQAATIVRRNIYKNARYDYSIFKKAHPQIGDRTTTLIYAVQGNFYCFPDKMSCYRRRENCASLTGKTYLQNIESTRQDFLYTIKLENYVKSTWNVDAGFRFHKRDLLTSAVYYWLLGEHTQGRQLIHDIVCSEHHGWTMFGYLPLGIIKKAYRRFVC